MKKKNSSLVWQFFDRIENANRTIAVVCKLCETQYKFFGNTTNLRAHMIRKHPIQWELSINNGILDEDTLRKGVFVDAEKNVNYETDTENLDEDHVATIHLVDEMQMHSDEEWLEEDTLQTPVSQYEPKKKKIKFRKIKREVLSPTPQTIRYHSTPRAVKKTPLVMQEPKKDECASFGDYIGNKLRKFSNTKTRSNIQQIITTLLWQAEYGVFDDADTVRDMLIRSAQSTLNQTKTTVQEQEMQTELTEQTDNIIGYNENVVATNDV